MKPILRNRNFRIGILIVADIIIAVLGAVLALALRFDISNIPDVYLHYLLISIPIYALITVVVMIVLKLYRRVWTYASINELLDIVQATLIIEALVVTVHVVTQMYMPRSYYFLQFIVMTVLLVSARFSVKIYKFFKGSYSKEKINRYIMVVGAGSAASILIKDFEKPGSHAKVVCAIDDNKNKANKYLGGVPIVGGRHDIKKNIRPYGVTEIIIAMPSASTKRIKDIIEICQETKLPIRILPSASKGLTQSVAQELRPVSYEDLLGREPVVVDESEIYGFLNNKVVMVTGGGGSIGSELCRQIVKCDPRRLIIFDIYENNAYELEMDLERHFPNINISTLIGSVRDYDRMEKVFARFKPDIVFHAAAHKHVPLMEVSPNEAVKNNCLGTWNVVKLADKYKVSNFVLISTDKAVRPTNIMGATKRICEMIVQVYSRKSKNTRFVGVRFGNVLGSNGSVIPLFLKQIEEGGPVTVTHKEVRRFFMTIPEAASLVLQASLYAKGGEIFVLDMGKPVKIYELAENLIKSKGLVPHEDISIEIVGLRPGEKLYEEVLMDEEGLDHTPNDLIYIGKPMAIDDDKFMHQLEDLIAEAEKNGDQIKEKMEQVCTTYTITNNT